MRKVTTVVIGFGHDFAAGAWASTVFAVWYLSRFHGAAGCEVLAELAHTFFHIGLAAIVVVLATGAGRGFTYVSGVYGEDAERARRRLLVAKHIVLAAVFGVGTWWQWTLVRAMAR